MSRRIRSYDDLEVEMIITPDKYVGENKEVVINPVMLGQPFLIKSISLPYIVVYGTNLSPITIKITDYQVSEVKDDFANAAAGGLNFRKAVEDLTKNTQQLWDAKQKQIDEVINKIAKNPIEELAKSMLGNTPQKKKSDKRTKREDINDYMMDDEDDDPGNPFDD